MMTTTTRKFTDQQHADFRVAARILRDAASLIGPHVIDDSLFGTLSHDDFDAIVESEQMAIRAAKRLEFYCDQDEDGAL